MLSMQEKQEIILGYYRSGLNKSEISRKLGINRKTVRKYLRNYEAQMSSLLEEGVDVCPLIEDIVSPPSYDSSNRKKRKVTDEIKERVQFYLSENKRKRSQGQHKQQMKKIDIHGQLKAEGYDIGYSSICELVNHLEEKEKESFIKQSYDYGEVCEFDWVYVKLKISGGLKIYPMAIFTSAKGNHRYGRVFLKEDTQSFQQSHSLYFEYVGGVFREMVYDNMKVAVKRFVGRHEKEATDGLLSLSIYYLFGFRFCNVRRGNEKGHVERSGEYLRRKAFSIVDEFDSIEEANDHLLRVCDELNDVPQKGLDNHSANDILKIERGYLLPLPPVRFECGTITDSRVDKYSTISIDTCRYSVPEKYVGKMITTKIYPEKLICYFEGIKICEHIRHHGFYQWYIKLDHYLSTLKRKPGALKRSVALKQCDERLRGIYEKHFQDNPKDFIDLLSYIKEKKKGIEEIENAVNQLLTIGSVEINRDKIKLLCDRDENGCEITKDGAIEAAAIKQLSRTSCLIPGQIGLGGKII